MRADVLEQIVDDYLQFKGYFTMHNVAFRPSPNHADYDSDDDTTQSDVDVVGIHPKAPKGTERVLVVSCKAWQRGFNTSQELSRLQGDAASHGKKAWKGFRELWVPKWNEAFHDAIQDLTGATTFGYRIAVTRLRGKKTAGDWADEPTIKANLHGCSFDFLTLETMWGDILPQLTTAPAFSDIGRLAQLLKAAGLTAASQVAEPAEPAPGSAAAVAEEAENAEDLS
jgi:hypothetical protein